MTITNSLMREADSEALLLDRTTPSIIAGHIVQPVPGSATRTHTNSPRRYSVAVHPHSMVDGNFLAMRIFCDEDAIKSDSRAT